jgi:hypothetical protein
VASDYDKRVALTRFLQRSKTVAEIKALADQAFADLQSGVSLTSVNFEGGGASGQISLDPATFLIACEDALLALGETSSVPQSAVIFTSFRQNFMET